MFPRKHDAVIITQLSGLHRDHFSLYQHQLAWQLVEWGLQLEWSAAASLFTSSKWADKKQAMKLAGSYLPLERDLQSHLFLFWLQLQEEDRSVPARLPVVFCLKRVKCLGTQKIIVVASRRCRKNTRLWTVAGLLFGICTCAMFSLLQL